MPSKPDIRMLWTRLRSMSGAEIRERARQEIYKRVDAARHSLKALPSAGFHSNTGAAPQFFFAPQQLPELSALLRERFPDQVKTILTRAEKICAHRFDLLGYENLDYGLKIDWHLDRVHGKRAPQKPWHKVRYLDFAEVGDVKITWELNRHQHLVTLAKAYVLSNDERFAKELFTQWYDWMEQNPYPIGVNWVSSLEVAFRAISWLWVKNLLAGSAVLPREFENDLKKALWFSGRHVAHYLSTYFSPNTHLLGEGVGLFFLGALCPELAAAPKWKQLGWKIVLEEAERQVRPDGLHFEQSSYYHVYALDLFLHASLLAARNDIAIPSSFEKTIEKMLEALLLTSQAGIPPRFGDDDGGRVFDQRRNRVEHMLDPLATGAILFGRGDFKAAAGVVREETVWLVGAEGVARFDLLPETPRAPHSAAFPESGLYVMAASGPSGPMQFVIDSGPQGSLAAGHGHADALSIQLTHAGNELLIDPGTCEYVGQDTTRNSFRGTAAHNTVQIDGRDQSQPKGPFSWERLITPHVSEWAQSESFDLFVGSCQRDGLVQRRYVFFCKPEFWLVRDVVEGMGKHRISVAWHLAPEMVRHKKDSALFLCPSASAGVAITTADSNLEAKLTDGFWSPVYGCSEKAPVLRFEREAALPAEIATVLVATADPQSVGILRRIEDPSHASRAVQGYSYSVRGEVHKFFFSPGGLTWALQNWSSDAEFLYCREDGSGIKTIALCSGAEVSFSGRQVLSAGEKIQSCEITRDRQISSKRKDDIVLRSWPETQSKESASQLEPVMRSEH